MTPARARCRNCKVRGEAICQALPPAAAEHMSRMVHPRRMPAGEMLYGGAGPCRWVGVLVSGVAKLTIVRPDGRQQIVGLQFPGDFVGHPFGAPNGVIAEAATDIELCCVATTAFEGLMAEHPEVERKLLQKSLTDLETAREWMFMLGRKNAEERVASLLLMMARRMTACDPHSDAQSIRFELPLSRTDIAECLGLRLETISRQFAHLKEEGVIETGRRRTIEVRDPRALARLAETASAN